MADGHHPASVICFGVFEVDLDARELRKRGLKVALQDQPFHVLATLLTQPGQVITRERLHQQLWSTDTFVDFDRGLNKAINKIREVLGDSAESPRFLETLPKRGYRFIAPIERSRPQEYTRADERPVSRSSGADRGEPGWQRLVRSSLLPPPHTSFLPGHFALSPDGTRLAFVAMGPEGTDQLWVRALSSSAAQPLSGTERARLPFWSPDGTHVGFFAARTLKTVEIAGGVVNLLCDAGIGRGGTWNAAGDIVFAPDVSGPLYRVRATGAGPVPATRIADERSPQSHAWPVFVDDDRFLFSVNRSAPTDVLGDGIYTGSLDSNDVRLVASDVRGNVAVASGCLVFVSSGALQAQPFDRRVLEMAGPPISMASHEVETESAWFQSGFSVSDTGLVVFQSLNDFASQLVWHDSSGNEIGSIPQIGYRDPNLSPDGRLLAVSSDEVRNGRPCICVYDAERDITRCLTDGGLDVQPAWSPDGKTIAYVSAAGTARWSTFTVAADGSSPPHLLCERSGCPDWSPDGHVVVMRFDGTRAMLAVCSASDDQIAAFGPGAEPQFSPNGQWIAHVQQGGAGILVQPFPGPGPRIQISAEGGAQPRWSHDGTQIFYIARDRRMMAVSFDPQTGATSTRQALFQTRIIAQTLVGFQYDVGPDGRFLVNSLPPSSCPLTLLTGWTALLNR